MALVAAISFAAVAAGLAVSRGLDRRGARLALTPDEGLGELAAPEFLLTDQQGRPVTRDHLLGRVTVVDFFFTHCPFVCPMMGRNLLDLQRTLRGSDVRFLSISVDPEHDTQERLLEYATSLGADLSTWTFARGEADMVRRISEGGFSLGVSDDPSRPILLGDGRRMNNIAHSSKFVLVGPDGRALALASGIDADDVARLAERARAVARAVGNPR